jgi:ubiquinone/menaquinone biosynthesis C-methylase UbiE
MEVIKQRWMRAQEYERNWWQQRIHSINLSYLRAFAEEISVEHADILSVTPETTILEIGSGPAGVLTFLKSRERYAIDPLEDFYSSVESFKTFRDPQVRYFSARAEELPFPDKKFDLIVMDNVLDHCENVIQSMSEISRVLKKNGSVYVRLNIYSWWGKLIRTFAERMELDKGHPNTFTSSEVKELFYAQGMQDRKEVRRPFAIVLQKHFRSNWIKGFLKMLTFSIPQSIVWIFQKTNQESPVV